MDFPLDAVLADRKNTPPRRNSEALVLNMFRKLIEAYLNIRRLFNEYFIEGNVIYEVFKGLWNAALGCVPILDILLGYAGIFR